jgi:hypothetical protein
MEKTNQTINMETKSPETIPSNAQDKHRQYTVWVKPSTYRIMQAVRDGLNMTWEHTWNVAAEQIIQSGLLPETQIELIRSILKETGASDYYIGNSPINSGPGWPECGPLVAKIDSATTEIVAQLEELLQAIASHQNAVLSYQPPSKDYNDEYHTIQIPKFQIPLDASTEDIISTLKPIIETIKATQVPPAL